MDTVFTTPITGEQVSEYDVQGHTLLRSNIDQFVRNLAQKLDNSTNIILEIAPQVHSDTKRYFSNAKIETLDIDSTSHATYIADLTESNRGMIDDNSFDLVICLEVLEHTLNPFKAVAELYRITKKGGLLAISTPFNFRIHGPLPDCFRFTQYGLYAMLMEAGFSKENITIESLGSDRGLMPLQYTTIAKK